MYLVIEVCDRELSEIREAPDYRTAANIANDMLKAHCKNIDELEAYKEYERDPLTGDWPPAMELCDAQSGSMSAWCNLNHMNYDVFIRPWGKTPDPATTKKGV